MKKEVYYKDKNKNNEDQNKGYKDPGGTKPKK